MTCSRLSIAASRPVGMLGRSFGQSALSMSMALALAARNSSSAGRCAAVGLHDLGNALDRPVGELCGVIAANFRGAALGTVRPRRIATGAHAAARAPAAIVSVRAAVGVRTVDAVVDIVVGIGPEVVIGIWPVNVIE